MKFCFLLLIFLHVVSNIVVTSNSDQLKSKYDISASPKEKQWA